MQTLTIDYLRTICPAAFSDSPAPDVSNRYEFIPTAPVVERLLSEGWRIRSAYQNRVQHDRFASHRIIFDVPSAPQLKQVGEVWPTATLYNSHNRTRRLSFSVGFFRTVCSNQAQVSVHSAGTNRIHIKGWMGLDADQVIENIMNEFGNLPIVVGDMRQRTLTPTERQRYAKEVLSIRNYSDTKYVHLFDDRLASEFLSPRRPSDDGMDIWTTYNVAQEAVLHGSRAGVQEVGRNRQLNILLWEHAKAWLN